MGNAYLKLASCPAHGYDVSIENSPGHRTYMTFHSALATQSMQADVLASAPTGTSNKPDSLWQRMLHSWIRTYELSSDSGTVPFLFL